METVLHKRLYVLVFIEHGNRRLHLGGVTAHPTGAWAVQQARNLAMTLGERIGELPFVIHDRAPLFTTAFAEAFTADGLRTITTLPQTPRMNAICERVIGTPCREILDRALILGERHLALVLREYLIHYNGHRPHQARHQRPPDIETQTVRDVADLRSVRRKRTARTRSVVIAYDRYQLISGPGSARCTLPPKGGHSCIGLQVSPSPQPLSTLIRFRRPPSRRQAMSRSFPTREVARTAVVWRFWN